MGTDSLVSMMNVLGFDMKWCHNTEFEELMISHPLILSDVVKIRPTVLIKTEIYQYDCQKRKQIQATSK